MMSKILSGLQGFLKLWGVERTQGPRSFEDRMTPVTDRKQEVVTDLVTERVSVTQSWVDRGPYKLNLQGLQILQINPIRFFVYVQLP